MKSLAFAKTASVAAIAFVFAGCSSTTTMTHTEKDTVVGAGGGAVAGAVVAGPVGAVVGGGAGGYVGHEVGERHTAEGRPGVVVSTNISSNSPYSATTVRNVQQALNDKGFNAGAADGRWGPSTETALRQFQTAQGLPVNGVLDARTMSALGVS